MASLQHLLSEEGFTDTKLVKNHKKVGYRGRTASDEAIALPIYICHDLKSIDFSKNKNDKAISRKGSSMFSSKRGESESGKSLTRSVTEGVRRKTDEPALDEVATRAVISILSGYVGQYLKDEEFRRTLRQRCYSCFVRKNKDSDNGKIFANIQLGIESIERLVESLGTKKELRMKLLRNSISLLTVVASLNSKSSKNGSTSGTPNSHLSACAQLYLSVVYKLEKNDRISARHLLQVFCDSPFLARDHLLPELWEHFFLPHLLHLKVWYGEEFDLVSDSDYRDKEKKIKILSKLYNDQMDMGTVQFAVYYKDWLKTGAQAPSIPSVPLPSRPSFGRSRRTSSDSVTSHSSINKSLYRAVFGPTLEHKITDTDETKGALMSTWDLDERNKVSFDEEHSKSRSLARHSLSSQSCRIPEDQKLWQPETQKVDYLRFLVCGVEPAEYSGHSNKGSSKRIVNAKINPSSDLSKAINTISSSDNLSDCEMAIHVMTTAWLHSHGDVAVETALSKPSVIEGMIEVLFGSNNDEILELTISMLADFVTRTEMNGQIILRADPELDIFIKLLKSSSLFLKAAALLYLVKPKAKHLTSTEWVPLVLRVLEFGDQVQTLFNVRCCPQEAAYYLLDQLFTGFDEDKNWDNARQVVTLGGLSLLAKRMEIGDASEKSKAGVLICCCIRAAGSCKHYLAEYLNKEAVLSLVVEKNTDYNNHAFSLLTELLCLQRTKVTKFLNGLMNGWSRLNTMQILLISLQKAQPEQCPVIAIIMLQLDLLGDPLKCSIYREEAVEAITATLESHTNEKVQEQLARTLLILGGRFSHTGESTTENWLLKEAGFDESLRGSFSGRDNVGDEVIQLDEEESAIEIWQRKTAVALLTSRNKKFVSALSDSTARSIPCLARASTVTIAWMSSFLHSIVDDNLQSAFCSILVPELIKSLHHDNALEERVLASYSLFNLSQCSDFVATISLLDKELMTNLGDLSRVTWTASELFMISTRSSRQRYPVLKRPSLQSARHVIPFDKEF
ncbi:putative E3 ubiquitin-protein ligase LIN isoform X2 [Daucus carota subsp. sativus]|uniref:putative E3 ubiquitin-protein ligase LIN isoform X2 n=1 Tax=Daucus carota subsp. sativus TaxID=79200 RepID=UPI0007EF4C08|nr:PREDICTED: putative E3 ubiquitin-protein ligase LIN isoform X1 [Daucus carota subsp. sativus]